MQTDIYNQQGEKTGQMELPASVFGVKVVPDLLHQVVVCQQANRRQGTANTKGRGEVSGGGKKPWRQKGTGRARHGSTRSPIWKGGGVAFGPTSQKVYKKKIPKTIKRSLTPLGLAVWIMDDGSRDKGCVRISTHNFSYSDQLKLQKILKAEFGIKCNIQKAKDKFWLWIKSESIPRLVKLIRPYFIPSLLYKLPRND